MASQPTSVESSGSSFSGLSPKRLLRLLYTHNPFYLLSVCFVLNGTSYWMQNAGGYRAWPLIGLVGGYILLLAVVAWVIVRVGQVWEDARSILLIILLLFVELSLTFDDPLLTAPRFGVLLVFGGFLFAAGIAEGLVWGLKIRLPWLLRLPFHGLLGLMIVYPLALAPRLQMLSPGETSWRIYAFFPIAAFLLLTLIPAIRKGPGYIRDSGTPWAWPWYPWTIFAGLLAGICVRGYALSLSFDPVLSLGLEAAMRLETAWGWYFLAPLVLAVGWLVLEFGLESKSLNLQRAALLFPLIAVGLSIPQSLASAPYAEFLKTFTGSVASPVFVSLLGALAFYGFAFLRRIPLSDLGLALILWLLAVVGPETVDGNTFTSPAVLPLALASVFLVLRGWAVRGSLPMLAGLSFGVAAVRYSLPSAWPGFWQNALSLHLMGLAVLLVGVMFQDGLAKLLRFVAAGLLMGGSVFALYGVRFLPPALPAGIIPGYVAGMILLAFGLAYGLGSRAFFVTGLFNLGVGCLALLREAYFNLRELPEWPGIASFGLAFLLLAIGGTISAAKAGLLDRLKFLLPRRSIEGRAES